MAFFSSEIRDKTILDSLKISLLPLSLRGIKGIAAGLIACIVLAFLLLWQPAYIKYQSLQKEKDYWLLMSSEMKHTQPNLKLSVIPTLDQLPDMIERCRSTFEKEGIDVAAFNVERFGEKQETGKVASLDYALVRLNLHGQWNGIVSSLKALEEVQEAGIHVKEVVLASQGGEVLLQIYLRQQNKPDFKTPQ
ncbi:hypothetical protein [Desulfosporosinus sp. BICA1-9]|uniref:hypothetical protein n=1 Tax=Desulfosporosinus sp. BICA1-9 TaxID=1531958 RepID=UPI0005F0F875|nr:hypothetical protein [Desulfosporosinus sp. BICA1-9]KJS49801.1 MAG: hypothetical protein VR66_06265 [Peptococcaceae bacterium BRH_c23]KJS78809.1 MAG: hypothetical protein JL57_30815 [Desulfosporosinus sp. BICA1-9]HBW36201.1 hypothetical protein [Desulfosporosinus sp.]